MKVTYRRLRADALDADLVNRWRAIQAGQACFRSPYFCPEFTQLVAQVRPDVSVVVIENDARPVGFFPFQRSLLDGGKPVGGPMSDYHGVIAEVGSLWCPAALLAAARLGAWSFDHLVDAGGHFAAFTHSRASSPAMDLSEGYQKYAEGRRIAGSDFIRKTEGLARKLAREHGDLEFQLHDNGAALDRLMTWKSNQYRESGLLDAFAVSWTRELMARLAQTCSDDFSGLCSTLSAGGRIVAVHMGMRSKTELHYWFPAYDPEFAKYSPGTILLLRMAEVLAGQGVRSIDLGKGDSLYKQRLMTGAVPLLEGFVERPSLVASVRSWQRRAEVRADSGQLSGVRMLPLRVLRSLKWKARYRD